MFRDGYIIKNFDHQGKQRERQRFLNPVLPGFYPDPSICRAGEDYYLVCSSFCYFPGLPIFHSRDLVHWNQIGYGITRKEQIDLSGLQHYEGLYAATIRFFEGTFYIVNTRVSNGIEGAQSCRNNFIITAQNPEGPWSDPIWIEGADGIDPSLYFEDGSLWYIGNYENPKGIYAGGGHTGIYLQQLDPETYQFAGERHILWDGEKTYSRALEAPHIYKHADHYYLMAAEGGTSLYHSIVMARSRTLEGPYEPCPRNPVVSHRGFSPVHEITCTGHGDLIRTQNDEWWMVLLGVRPYRGANYNLGRETFLVPVCWEEDGWLRIDNETASVRTTERFPELEEKLFFSDKAADTFESESLSLEWNMLRQECTDFYTVMPEERKLRLYLQPAGLMECTTPSFLGKRQRHFRFQAGTCMEFSGQEWEEAGMALVQSNEHFITFTCRDAGAKNILSLKITADREERTAEEILIDTTIENKVYLWVIGTEKGYYFAWGTEEKKRNVLSTTIEPEILSTQRADGFTGAFVGIYATSNGRASENHADYLWFSYQEIL
ncbi:Non-reducing end alpha-L-arabinofuranosidase BoGH43B [Blautia producta]|uniref:Non-reducing end alpha-L-arabinofuranosidase BoGH43B n=1 Tax=Blautia producta TaxID=33035 RepID=A0A4P6M5P8_9FIRM|nr:glycoside hydrolase family 43 protein [Blautia producta]QBE99565.1 Non-reducing end alpha-L-arabinofuranosidase BoGH43B [Blautia producta]